MSRPDPDPRDGPIALYVHIPFCETKCPYCDFNTYAKIEPLIPEYVDALRREVDIWGDVLGHPEVSTIFFGGGTPSYLPPDDIGSILDGIAGAFDVSRVRETTLESNPGDLTQPRLEAYLRFGVDRLSIGVQSLDDRLLGLLGRRHSAAQAIDAYRLALEAGFENVSIDLMYGLPHQSLDDWRRTLSAAVEMRPHHLSMYCLTLEPGTPMEQSVRTGQLPEPDPDLAADMYLAAEEALAPLGYRHYEISNWAQPGRESRHNLTYWRNEAFVGVGPGAHSYLSGNRFHNLKSPREYITRFSVLRPTGPGFQHGRLDFESVPVVDAVEPIDRRMEMAETMMLGLRLETGVGVDEFAERFGLAPVQAYPEVLDEMEAAGLLQTSSGAIRLTKRGRLLGNEVFSRFFE